MVTTKIGGRIESVATDKTVAGANAIYDDNLQLDQQTINANVRAQLEGISGATFGKIIVSLETLVNGAKTSGEELIGATVTLTDAASGGEVGSQTIGDTAATVTFNYLTEGHTYVISVSAIAGYSKPADVTIENISGGSTYTRTMQYGAEVYTIAITSNQGSSDSNISNAKVTVDGTQYSNGATIKTASGTAIVPTATPITGYAVDITTSNHVITAAYATTYVKLNMVGVNNGVEGNAPSGAQGTVKYAGGTDQVLNNNTATAQVPTGTPFTVTYAAVGEYGTPAQYSGVAAGPLMTVDKASYVNGMLVIEVTASDNDDTDLAKVNVSIAVNGGSDTQLTGSVASHKKTFQAAVTPGQTYSITFGAVEGYDTPASISGTKGSGIETKSASYTTVVYTASITSNQTNDSEVNGATVNVTYNGLANAKAVANGNSVKVPTSLTPTASASDITGYAKTVSVDNNLHTVTLAYSTEIVSISISKDGGEGDVTAVAVTVKDSSNNTLGTGTGSISNLKVPSGTVYHIVLSNSPEGYSEPDVTAVYTAASTADASRSLSFEYTEVKELVDLGLPSGIKWCNHNIGGTNPEDYGYYFSWGNVDGHAKGSGYNFNQSTYRSTPGSSLTGNIAVGATYDIARNIMGSLWRLPTKDEFNELYDNTDSEWTTLNGVAGRKFMKKSDHSVFIFFPACGDYNGTSLSSEGTLGNYWSSTYFSSSNAYNLNFNSSNVNPENNNNRYYGYSGRAVQYPTQPITLTFTTTDGTSNEGVEVTLTDNNGSTYTATTDANGQINATVAIGSVTVNVNHYNLNSSTITVTKGYSSYNVSGTYIVEGVYAYYSDGSLKDSNSADSNAIGVAVLTSNVQFVIGKTHNTSLEFGGYQKDLSNIGVVVTSDANTAKTDFAGEDNTTKIINACAGYTNSSIAGAPAAEWCRQQFDGNGYLGSLGEWQEAYNNKAAVDAMMTKIGGTAINTSNYHWASTLYNASFHSWILLWSNGSTSSIDRDLNYSVRAFRALNP